MIRLDERAFDPAAELARFTASCGDATGGIASFLGKVRGESHGCRITALTLEYYPAMAARQLEDLEAEARSRWPLTDCLVIHRVGRMLPGEAIVLIATASAHRDAAFDACRYLIDWLKTSAPFWKFEETPDGGDWVAARESDAAAARRWVP
jgi:molybdopterin synthase catalytic subunit